MNGVVDEQLRALVTVFLASSADAAREPLRAWIDTAFNGGLLLPGREIERLGLREYSTPAILADGSEKLMPTYTCHLEWFGDRCRTQVVANDGEHALLGTMLLVGRDLAISYRRGTVTLA